MRRLDDLPAQICIHWNFDDASLMQRPASEEFPSIKKLLHGDTPNTEWFGQVTVT